MLGLARYAMKSPLQTGVLAALFAVIPMLYLLSAALVALTTLRHGLSYGTRILVSALFGGVISWYLTGVPLSLLVLVLSAVMAEVLRVTEGWARTMVFGSLVGLLLAFIAQSVFEPQFNSILDSIQQVLIVGGSKTQEWHVLESVRPWVGYLVVGTQVMEALLSLLLARYWQAGLYNPGGLKAEMRELRFTRQEVFFLAGATLVSLLYLPGAIVLFGVPLVFVGLALMHGIVTKLRLGGQWLVAIYISALLFSQYILPLLVLVVIVDSMFDIRSRIPERTKSDNE